MSEVSFLVKIDNKYDGAQRQLIGNEIVEFIKRRTRNGLDRNNRPFKPYAPSYTSSLDFRLAGKSRDKVNLEFTGDMLIGLEVLSHGPGYIKIGFQGRDGDKAKWNAEKGRDLLGLMPRDLEQILSSYPLSESTVERFSIAASFAEEFLRNLFR